MNTDRVLSVLHSLNVASVQRHDLSEGFTLLVLDDGTIRDSERDLVERCCWMTTLAPPVLEQYLTVVHRGTPPLLLFPGHV
jgi:hypothetical protein